MWVTGGAGVVGRGRRQRLVARSGRLCCGGGPERAQEWHRGQWWRLTDGIHGGVVAMRVVHTRGGGRSESRSVAAPSPLVAMVCGGGVR